MNDKRFQAVLWGAFLVLFSAPLLIWTSALAYAGPELPPRETPVPVQPPDEGDDRDNTPIGAHIVLYAPSAPGEVWTLVQWQDQTGSWHDVDGWQGTLDDGGRKMWWLAPDLFGKGPFRWLVYGTPDRDPEAEEPIAISETFYLPGSPGTKLQIKVPLPE